MTAHEPGRTLRPVGVERLTRLPRRVLPGGWVVHEALTVTDRRRGLAGLAVPPPRTVLHLRPCRSVQTFGMRFALDLVWLAADGSVERLDLDVPPRRQRTCRAAASVLEVRAGEGEALAAVLAPDHAPAAILPDVDRDLSSPARFLTRLRQS